MDQGKPGGGGRRAAKLSYKDQRRLEELDRLLAALPVEIARLEGVIADPALYTRDPKAFETAMAAMDTARADLAGAEDEWLALEEKREAG